MVLTEVITKLDPSLSADTVTTVTRGLFSRPSRLRRLAWIIEDTPNLLTGGGAQACAPGVLRLIDRLCDAGAQAIVRPACPRCERVIWASPRNVEASPLRRLGDGGVTTEV